MERLPEHLQKDAVVKLVDEDKAKDLLIESGSQSTQVPEPRIQNPKLYRGGAQNRLLKKILMSNEDVPGADGSEAAKIEHGEIQSSEQDLKEIISSEPEHKEVIASKPEHREVIASEPGHTDVIASEPEHTEVMTCEPEHTEVIASEPEHKEVIASEPEHTEVIASESLMESSSEDSSSSSDSDSSDSDSDDEDDDSEGVKGEKESVELDDKKGSGDSLDEKGSALGESKNEPDPNK
jgi:hypothetical protein